MIFSQFSEKNILLLSEKNEIDNIIIPIISHRELCEILSTLAEISFHQSKNVKIDISKIFFRLIDKNYTLMYKNKDLPIEIVIKKMHEFRESRPDHFNTGEMRSIYSSFLSLKAQSLPWTWNEFLQEFKTILRAEDTLFEELGIYIVKTKYEDFVKFPMKAMSEHSPQYLLDSLIDTVLQAGGHFCCSENTSFRYIDEFIDSISDMILFLVKRGAAFPMEKLFYGSQENLSDREKLLDIVTKNKICFKY